MDLLSVSSNLEKDQVNGYRLLYLKSHRKQASWDSLRTTDTSPLRSERSLTKTLLLFKGTIKIKLRLVCHAK